MGTKWLATQSKTANSCVRLLSNYWALPSVLSTEGVGAFPPSSFHRRLASIRRLVRLPLSISRQETEFGSLRSPVSLRSDHRSISVILTRQITRSHSNEQGRT